MEYSFNCYGHENITARHKTTLEFTKDEDLSLKGDCIVGVKAGFQLNKIKDRPKNIIYYQNMTYLDDIIMLEMIKIAKHFSGRTIIIKPKYNGMRKKLFDN